MTRQASEVFGLIEYTEDDNIRRARDVLVLVEYIGDPLPVVAPTTTGRIASEVFALIEYTEDTNLRRASTVFTLIEYVEGSEEETDLYGPMIQCM